MFTFFYVFVFIIIVYVISVNLFVSTYFKKRKKCRIRKVSITILCFIMHFICSWTFVSGILQCSENYFCTEYKMIPVIIFLFRYFSRLRYRSGSVS